MANVLIEENTMVAIGNAIRERSNSTNTLKPAEMANAILNMENISGIYPYLEITGDAKHQFYFDNWNWLIELFEDKITTKDITSANYMFYLNPIEEIPFVINVADAADSSRRNFEYMFANSNIKKAPVFNGMVTNPQIGGMYENCYYLNDTISFDWIDWTSMSNSTKLSDIFSGCKSLRSIPKATLESMQVDVSSYLNTLSFDYCYSLDGIEGYYPSASTFTYNSFQSTALYCARLKDFIFSTDNGQPYVRSWKNQTISLTSVGWTIGSTGPTAILGLNSGITVDKKVTDDATYQALKDDADWYTSDVNYSRYDHDSAVRTINSLPDTSAYLATQSSGTNTIKFKGSAGTSTDGGAISNLTEEEISVAAAKGWTVSFV